MMQRAPLLATAALAAALVAGCCNKDKSKDAPGLPASAMIDPNLPPDPVMIHEGDTPADVTMTMQDGREVKLSSLRGKLVVLYFYPKDNTPGCTAEAQELRDNFEKLKANGITVIGVSTQDADSHKAFIAQEKLPFDLAVDTDEKIAKAFEVPVQNGHAERQTFLIDKDGKIKKVWRVVTPAGHAEQIIVAANRK
jgi:thioredoxin-dependent peroxiredoxin